MDTHTMNASVVLPIKRARPSDTTTLGSTMPGHDDTHPSFTPELAKMLGAYVAAYGKLPCTESIPPPVTMVRLGTAPTRILPQANSVTLGGVHSITQDIPLVAGLTLHLEIGVDTDKLAFTALVQIKGIPFIGTVTIANCNVGVVGQRCEFGYKGILHAALYFSGRTLKLDLDVAGNPTTIDIIKLPGN